MRIRLCLLTVCILMTVSLNAQVPCSAITRNPQVLEALLASEPNDYAAENAPADVTTTAGQLSELQFSPIVVQAGDALYLEYRGRDFTVYAEYAGGSMTAFDAPEKASFDEWRKGVLLLDHRLGLNQRLLRLSAMAQEPQRVEFRNIRIIRAGKPIFEFSSLTSHGSPKLRPAVKRVLPCIPENQGSVASAAFEPPMAYPPSLPHQPNTVFGMATAPSAAALMFQSGGGSGGNHYKFTGKELDEESGLYNYGARMYSPTMGRFLTPDWSAKPVPVPYADLTNPQTLNLYSYAYNNPTRFTDPDGHCPGCITGTGIIFRAPKDLDEVQETLDWLGFYGPIGPFADGLNAGISYARGNRGEAAMNLAAMIPLGGDALKAAKMSSRVFATALDGGKHAGFLANYANRSVTEISKGIDSIGKQIAQHEDKIANPGKYVKDFDKLSKEEQQGLLNKWQKDINRQKEQKEILEKLKEAKT